MDDLKEATRDPVAMLEQLLGHVGRLMADMANVKADMANVKADMANVKADMANVKADMASVKADMATKAEMETLRNSMEKRFESLETNFFQLMKSNDEENKAYKTQVEGAIERKTWLAEQRVNREWQSKYNDLERRIAELEEAERKRQEGKGA